MRKSIIIILLVILSCSNGYAQNTLEYYINKALEFSPLLKKQETNNKIIDLDLNQYQSIYKSPKISVNSNILLSPILSKDGNAYKLEWLSSGSNNYIGYDLGATNGGQFLGLISIEQPLFTKQYYAAQKNKAAVEHENVTNEIKLATAELKQVVTHQYILCLLYQKNIDIIDSVYRIIKEQKQQMATLVKSGIYKLTDLKLLEIELENMLLEHQKFIGIYLENFNSLRLLCGIVDSSIYRLQNVHLSLTSKFESSIFFTDKFKLDSVTVLVNRDIYNLNYLPQLNFFGDAGLNATYLPGLNRFGFSIGISLKWNLFDGQQKQINYEKSLLELKNIKTDREYFEKQNYVRKNNILSEINNLDKQLTLIDKQLVEYSQIIEIYKKEILKGLVSVLELKTVIKDFTLKQETKVNVLMSKEILINTYNYWNQ